MIIRMGYIEKEVILIGNKSSRKVKALFDSGAEKTVMSKSEAEITCTIQKLKEPVEFQTTKNHIVSTSNFCPLQAKVRENKQSYILRGKMYVLPDGELAPDHDILIGAETLQENKITLQFDEKEKENKLDLSRCTKIFRY